MEFDIREGTEFSLMEYMLIKVATSVAPLFKGMWRDKGQSSGFILRTQVWSAVRQIENVNWLVTWAA